MRHLKHPIRLLIAVCLSYAWVIAGFELGDAMRYRADQGVEQARLNAQASREQFKAQEQRSIAAYFELEAKRTDLEKANRRVVMAEYRLQRVCKQTKTRC
jgi:flagellar basal body-associated protein FliL